MRGTVRGTGREQENGQGKDKHEYEDENEYEHEHQQQHNIPPQIRWGLILTYSCARNVSIIGGNTGTY